MIIKINPCSKCGSNNIGIKYIQCNNHFHPYYNYYVKCNDCKKGLINLFSKNELEAIQNWNKENPIEEIKFISKEDANKLLIEKNKDLTKDFLEKLSDKIKENAKRGCKDIRVQFKNEECENYDFNIIFDTLDKKGFNGYNFFKSSNNYYVLYIGWN